MQSVDPADYEIIAGRFSEGSNALKDLLIFLWNHGIMTRACCAGHDDKLDKYIMLDYISNTDEIVNILFQCNQMLKSAKLNLVKKFNIFSEAKYSIGIHTKDLNAEQFFTAVKQTFMRYLTQPCHIPNTFYDFFDVFFQTKRGLKMAMLLCELPIDNVDVYKTLPSTEGAYKTVPSDEIFSISLRLDEIQKLYHFFKKNI